MNCQMYRDEIEELSPHAEPGAACRAHAAACAPCAEQMRVRMALRGLVGELSRVDAPDDFEFRLRARLRRETLRPSGGLFTQVFSLRSAAAVAACLVIALTAIVYLRRPVQTQPAVASNDALNKETAQKTREIVQESALAVDTTEAQSVEAVTNDKKISEVSEVVRSDAGRVGRNTRAGELNKAGRDFAVRGAPVVGRDDVAANRPVPVSYVESKQPLRVVVRDESGRERVLSVRPVSFGSQELGRLNLSSSRTASSTEGVW